MSLEMLKQLTTQSTNQLQVSEQQSQRLTFPDHNRLKLAPCLKGSLASWATSQTHQPVEGVNSNETARQRLAELRLIEGLNDLSAEIEQSYKDFGAVVVSGLPITSSCRGRGRKVRATPAAYFA